MSQYVSEQPANAYSVPQLFLRLRFQVTVQAMKAGAVEFLIKPFDDEVLLTAIRQAITRSTATLNDHAEPESLRECYASLTPREQEVMRLVVSGMFPCRDCSSRSTATTAIMPETKNAS